ncbi:antitoxin [Streptomyces formicae]|uniref:Antitoxin n=1 Tax=Streptomyces formicae TaxID=1616117 RepID=A0ABY3WGH4_9ACTN|nr:antitoxin [Streptomyces formicae]UNM11671.1 antitoxin [Streptomyces formicae]
MGILETLKTKLAPAKDKVSDLAHQHEDKIEKFGHGLDKAARKVDERTKGKYSDKIESGTGKAKDALGRLTHKDEGTGTDESTGQKDQGTMPPAS